MIRKHLFLSLFFILKETENTVGIMTELYCYLLLRTVYVQLYRRGKWKFIANKIFAIFFLNL